jgi:septal ring factor EnvC (AmiA/AmiB activator)
VCPAVAVVGLVVPMLMLMQSTSNNIVSTRNQLDNSNKLLSQKTAQQQSLNKSITDLEKKAAAVKKAYDGLRNTMDYLTAQHEIVNGDLALVLSAAPQNMVLTGVSEAVTSLTVSGKAPREDVLSRARRDPRRFAETVVAHRCRMLDEGQRPFYLTLKRK